jgi:excisionase family DNA binding protein
MAEDGNYSIKEAAEIMGVTEKTVRRRILTGELKAAKVPTRYGDAWRIMFLPEGAEPAQNSTKQQITEDYKQLYDNVQRENKELLNSIKTLKEQRDTLEKQSLDLARIIGNYEAENRRLNEQVKLLTAPKKHWWQFTFKKDKNKAENVA